MKFRRACALALLASAAAPAALAHPGHGPMDLSAGFTHPFGGWDHLLAMVAVGLWAAQLGGRARWALPASFVGAMTAGAAAGIAGLALPGLDSYILASVLLLGALVAAAARLSLGLGACLVAAAGLCHGLAHGAEMPSGAGGAGFIAGMIAGTALLHALGVGAGLLAARRGPALARWAGAGVLAGGVALLLA